MRRIKKHWGVAFVLAALLVLPTAVPAASDEHDRPDDVPADEPVTEPSGTGADEGGFGTASHGETGDFDDFVSIRNVSGSGLSRLNLNTTDSLVINSDTWRLANDADTNNFTISEGGTTNRFVMRQGGNVGLGTDDPLSPLHIDRTGGFQFRMQGSGADYRMDAFGTSLRIGDSSNTNQFRIFGADAPFNALTVGSGVGVGTASPAGGLHVSNIGGAPTDALVVADGIGIGTSAPTADLDIHDIDANGVTEYRFQSGGATWRNGVPSSTGVFQFTKIGTGGAELLVRERNHAVATVDVDGPVKASQFKVSSDRNLKTDVAPIDGDSVLEKLNNLPISSWEFKACKAGEGRLEDGHGRPPKPCTGEGTGQRHIGPMAQDFQRQFGLGDGESISLTDANGIMMASLQALTRQLEERDATIAAMEQQFSDLEARLERLEAQDRGRGGSPKG